MAIYVYTEIEPPFEREHEYTYTGSDQVLTIPRNGKYFLETKGAGSNSGAGGLATAYFNFREGDKLAVMVGQKGGSNSVTYGFGGKSNYSSGGGGAGLTGFFTGETTITATDSARALIIGGGAGGTIKAGDGGAGGGTTGANGSASGYGTAGGGGTQTGRGSGGNAGTSQFNGGNGTGTYGAGGGGGRRGGNGSAGDGSSADDKGAGGGSGYISSEGMDGTNTQGGGSAKSTDGRAKITFIEDWTPPVIDYTLLRGPCDEGFHVPLEEEWQAITKLELTTNQVIQKMHIPLSGRRFVADGGWQDKGSKLFLWTSSPYNIYGCYLVDYSAGVIVHSDGKRVIGCPIRAFRDTPIIPDETRTETVTGKVWYNSDLGLISVLVGTNQYITMQDKNVGATVVWNSGDTIDTTNSGKYFQRGNNYGFERGSTGDTSSTQVDTSNYGPSNPYSSSTFISISSDPFDRSTTKNDNLRGYTDFNS